MSAQVLPFSPQPAVRRPALVVSTPRRVVSRDVPLPDDHAARMELMLRMMAAHAKEAVADERFVAFARRVTSSHGRTTSPAERARRALAFVQSLRYVPDPVGRERVQSPQATLRLRAGDCNSLTGLLGALLGAVGIDSRFVATKVAPGAAEWGHVYLEVELGEAFHAADPSPLGEGARATYLRLGRAPLVPIEPLRLWALEPDAPVEGFLSNIVDAVGDVLEHVRDFTVNVATAKYFRKGLGWAWGHMGEEMRMLVAKVGPMVASYYAPGLGKPLSQLALGLLEQDRLEKKERKAYKKALAEAKAQGVLPSDWQLGDGEHLEALWLAGNMPAAEKAAWHARRGERPPARQAARARRSSAADALPAAALFLGAMVL